jgi:uncharacterized protein YdeI (YjbR/CyaY-like superfamily)
VKNAAEWRAWLAENHALEPEIWLVYFKPSASQTGIDYEASVQEALCFGWVDSIIKKIDFAKYARKFNPRRPNSFWSETNKNRMEKLITEGRVTTAGMQKYNPDAVQKISNAVVKAGQGGVITIPLEILHVLQSNSRAWEEFQHLSASHQRRYVIWVINAKKVETRQKRLNEVIAALEDGVELGLK